MDQEKTEKLVVLVDENDVPIGVASKSEVHTQNTPLHQAYSVYVFNSSGQVLIQKRSITKKTWGGFWSNSYCGHPEPDESRIVAARRRAQEELGITVENLIELEPYRYRFEYNGIVENEICPIFVARTKDSVKINEEEVEGYRWINWETLVDETTKDSLDIYSPWSKEQVKILNRSKLFIDWLKG